MSCTCGHITPKQQFKNFNYVNEKIDRFQVSQSSCLRRLGPWISFTVSCSINSFAFPSEERRGLRGSLTSPFVRAWFNIISIQPDYFACWTAACRLFTRRDAINTGNAFAAFVISQPSCLMSAGTVLLISLTLRFCITQTNLIAMEVLEMQRSKNRSLRILVIHIVKSKSPNLISDYCLIQEWNSNAYN